MALIASGFAPHSTFVPSRQRQVLGRRRLNHSTGGQPTHTYYDVLGREVRTDSVGFDGRRICVDTAYNERGLVASKNRLYFEGDTPRSETLTYDAQGRLASRYRPETSGSSETQFSYNDLSSTTRNDLGQQTSETRRLDGKLKSVTDAAGGVTFGGPRKASKPR